MTSHTDPIVLNPEGSDIQGEVALILERGPIVPVVLPGGLPAWSVADMANLKQILASDNVSKDPRRHWPAYRDKRIGAEFPLINWVNTTTMFTSYGVDHRRLRSFVLPSFTKARTDTLEPRIQEIADDTVKRLAAAPQTEVVDIRQEYAYPLPLQAINLLIGVADHLVLPLRACVDGIFDVRASADEAAANFNRMIGLLKELADYSRDHPGDNMVSSLVANADDPEVDFSEEELIGTLYLIINAGHETTVNLIDQAIFQLLTHPEHRAAALDGSVSWDEVIEEALRLEAPVAHAPLRYAVRDFTQAGVTIKEGDLILAGFAGPGRDPQVHGENANRFDPRRPNKDHLAFGYGAHRCLGSALARMEARVALPTLFEAFPEMDLAVSPDELESLPGIISNAHRSLPVFLNGQ